MEVEDSEEDKGENNQVYEDFLKEF